MVYTITVRVHSPATILSHSKALLHRVLMMSVFIIFLMKVRLKDCTWNVYRRYSEFEAFHDALVEESVLGPEEYPSLPKKRWFELGRWTSR